MLRKAKAAARKVPVSQNTIPKIILAGCAVGGLYWLYDRLYALMSTAVGGFGLMALASIAWAYEASTSRRSPETRATSTIFAGVMVLAAAGSAYMRFAGPAPAPAVVSAVAPPAPAPAAAPAPAPAKLSLAEACLEGTIRRDFDDKDGDIIFCALRRGVSIADVKVKDCGPARPLSVRMMDGQIVPGMQCTVIHPPLPEGAPGSRLTAICARIVETSQLRSGPGPLWKTIDCVVAMASTTEMDKPHLRVRATYPLGSVYTHPSCTSPATYTAISYADGFVIRCERVIP